jgi:hypothetical protein
MQSGQRSTTDNIINCATRQYGHEPYSTLYFGGNLTRKPIQDDTGRTATEILAMVGTINKAIPQQASTTLPLIIRHLLSVKHLFPPPSQICHMLAFSPRKHAALYSFISRKYQLLRRIILFLSLLNIFKI